MPIAAAAALLGIALLYNLLLMPPPAVAGPVGLKLATLVRAKAPGWLTTASMWTGVQQRWNLFAPKPIHADQHFVLTGVEADGTTIDLLTRWQLRPFEFAANQYRIEFPSHRLLKYFSRLQPILRDNPALFTDYVCRKVNAAPDHQIFIIGGQVSYYTRSILLPGLSSNLPTILRDFSCKH